MKAWIGECYENGKEERDFVSFQCIRTSILFFFFSDQMEKSCQDRESRMTPNFQILMHQESYLAISISKLLLSSRWQSKAMKLDEMGIFADMYLFVVDAQQSKYFLSKTNLTQSCYFKSCVWYNIVINDPTQLLELRELEMACFC